MSNRKRSWLLIEGFRSLLKWSLDDRAPYARAVVVPEAQGLPQLLQAWQRQSLVLPPELPEKVREVFRRCGAEPTAQVIQMYSMLGGMSEMDDEHWRLWSLAEVEKENAERSPFGLLFSDYLIDSWCFRLKTGECGEMEVYLDAFDGQVPRRVAGCLQEFFTIYVRDPDRILLP